MSFEPPFQSRSSVMFESPSFALPIDVGVIVTGSFFCWCLPVKSNTPVAAAAAAITDCDREGEPAAGPAAGADLACERCSCCGCEFAAGLVAVVGVLGEGGGEEVVEGLGQVGALVGELGWGFVEVGEDDGQLGVAVEGACAGEAFVEDAGE